MAADWSALPFDALDLISKRLPSIVDYVRFRSVCSSWRSSSLKRPQHPWLAGYGLDGVGNRVYKFFTLSDDHQILPLEDLPEFTLLGKRRCRGSSGGWLALELGPDLSLWNPVTGARVQLPPYRPNELGCRCDRRFGDGDGNEDDELQEYDFLSGKVILSADPVAEASDCVVVNVCHCEKTVTFCRPGDDSWTQMASPHFRGWNTDAVCYKGRIYISAGEEIFVCNFGQAPEAVNVLPTTDPPLNELMKGPFLDASFMVESAGDLLYVTVYFALRLSEANSKGTWDSEGELEFAYQCEVFKVEWGGEQGRLMKMESLGDRSLFLGRNHAFSLSASQHPGCRPNCIYLEDHHKPVPRIRVCDLEDGTNEIIPHYLNWIPCAWFRPSMLS